MWKLEGNKRSYAWGSRTAIAQLQGRPVPSEHPEAELWFGAHPSGPASVCRADGLHPDDLLSLIKQDPSGQLGEEVIGKFGRTLPYMVKILAAEEPLSLQAHPSLAQAKAGFDREERQGIPIDAPQRNYRDPNHKPELIVALTSFEALGGFREPAQSAELIRALSVPELDHYLGMIVGQPNSQTLRAIFTTWVTMPTSTVALTVEAVVSGCIRYLEDTAGETDDSGAVNKWVNEARVILNLAEQYPADPGVLCALLLNRVTLEPGQALYMPAGSLHAYISGVGVEVMANSDNVLRGGLTAKHVDVPELVRILEFEPLTIASMTPALKVVGSETIYLTEAPDFLLSRIELDGTGMTRASSIQLDSRGPQVLVVTTGTVVVTAQSMDGPQVTVHTGEGVWMPTNDRGVSVRAKSSTAQVFRTLVQGH